MTEKIFNYSSSFKCGKVETGRCLQYPVPSNQAKFSGVQMMRVNKLVSAIGTVVSSELLAGIQASSESNGRFDLPPILHLCVV